MRTIKLKEFWSEDNVALVKNGSLTEDGCDMYWKSFDSAIEFNVGKHEACLVKEQFAKLTGSKRKFREIQQQQVSSHPKGDDIKNFFKKHKNDKYHWQKSAMDEDSKKKKEKRF